MLPSRWRDWGLIAATVAFLLVHAPESAALLMLFSVTTYYLSRPGRHLGLRACATAALIVAVLAYFKIAATESRIDAPGAVVIPLGLSYYSFRCLHYLAERYRGTLSPHGFGAFLSYTFFLPTIVVGPIHRARPFLEDLAGKRWESAHLSAGMERILYGYVKIAVLGNFLVTRQLGGAIGQLDPSREATILYLGIVRDGLNLYFQFAGFSDIAIGFARLLGYRVIENFDWPYLQRNIADFWRSWHISLTSWCREYVYMPTLGVTRNPYLAVLATFVIIGLWHDLTVGYLAWGVYNGLGVLACLQWQRLRRRLGLRRIRNRVAAGVVHGLSALLTVHFFWFGGVLVRQPDLRSAAAVYAKILLGWL
jgi:alginate O-acetyltransferase complex protein AlgI